MSYQANTARLLTASTLLVAAAGCTTVETFKEMSPDQRAQKVCAKQSRIASLWHEKSSLESNIAEAQKTLARGYRIHKHCQKERVYGPLSRTCVTKDNVTKCTESRPESFVDRCTEIPIPINAEAERNNIAQWSASLKPINEQYRAAWDKCYNWAVKLSPEEAFENYPKDSLF